MSHQIEQTLQEQYIFYLYSRGVLFCASAGGMRTNMRTAIKMKKAGYKKGHPDVIIYESRAGWHGMTTELKVGGYPSAEQKEWQSELLKRGYYAIIVPRKLDFYEARNYLEKETSRYLAGEIKLEDFRNGV
jgi:hypothetical protein